jgi:hypothetical protein
VFSIALVVLLSAPPVTARAGIACSADEARAFDFWLGHWTIEQKILQRDGTWIELPARTSVERAAAGCALLERWEGEVQFFWEGMTAPAPMSGLSIRSWDASTEEWSIWWMDSRTPLFGEPFRGTFRGGRGEFLRVDAAGGPVSRIVFSEIRSESVLWTLAISRDGGKSWSDLWVMKMRRAAKPLSDQVGE